MIKPIFNGKDKPHIFRSKNYDLFWKDMALVFPSDSRADFLWICKTYKLWLIKSLMRKSFPPSHDPFSIDIFDDEFSILFESFGDRWGWLIGTWRTLRRGVSSPALLATPSRAVKHPQNCLIWRDKKIGQGQDDITCLIQSIYEEVYGMFFRAGGQSARFFTPCLLIKSHKSSSESLNDQYKGEMIGLECSEFFLGRSPHPIETKASGRLTLSGGVYQTDGSRSTTWLTTPK